MSDLNYDFLYSGWRFIMWHDGYGSYEAIEWAVQHCLLTPLKYPTLTAPLRKWLIKTFYKQEK